MSKSILFCSLCLLFNLLSCSEFFEQELVLPQPKFDKLLAINTFISSDEDTLIIPVSRNFGIFENIYDSLFSVLDAKVEWIEDGKTPLILPLNTAYTPSTYFLQLSQPLKAKTGYTIRVSHPDYPTISARQVMPGIVPLDSAVYDPDGPINSEGRRQQQVRFSFKDPADEVNYYEFNLRTTYLNRVSRGFDQATKKFLYDTVYRKGDIYLYGATEPTAKPGPQTFLVSDRAFNGRSITIGINFGAWQTVGDIEAIMRNISYENYLYKISRRKFDDARSDPFVDPVILYSNVQNGIGVFGLQTEQRKVVK